MFSVGSSFRFGYVTVSYLAAGVGSLANLGMGLSISIIPQIVSLILLYMQANLVVVLLF